MNGKAKILEAFACLRSPVTAHVIAWRAGLLIDNASTIIEALEAQGIVEQCGSFCGEPLYRITNPK